MRVWLCEYLRVARIVWVGRRMSLADAFLLAGEFECVKEHGDADDSEDRRKLQVES